MISVSYYMLVIQYVPYYISQLFLRIRPPHVQPGQLTRVILKRWHGLEACATEILWVIYVVNYHCAL